MKAHYIIFDDGDGENCVMLAAPVKNEDYSYFVRNIAPALRSLTDNDYCHGPAVILHTFSRFSYILFGNDVYWCAEWGPGLVVVRFSPDGTLAWEAFRSQIPTFGGRKANEEDLRDYDDNAENHQYNLVFRAWDSQFDDDTRKWNLFERADDETRQRFQLALKHSDELGGGTQSRYAGKEEFEPWSKRCKQNLEEWAGNGVRIAGK